MIVCVDCTEVWRLMGRYQENLISPLQGDEMTMDNSGDDDVRYGEKIPR